MFAITLIAFVLSCSIYGLIAALTFDQIKSPFDYFHTRRERNGVIVLVLASLTLGTGLLYMSDLAHRNPLLALVVAPFGVLLGYWLLARYIAILRKSFDRKIEYRTYLDLIISTSVSENNEKAKRAVALYVILQVVVFMLLCAFELYTSSKLYLALTTPSDGESWISPLGVSTVLLFVAIFYTWAGGMRAAIGTDVVQAFLIGISIIVLLAVLVFMPMSLSKTSEIHAVDFIRVDSRFGWLIAISVVVNAVMTQFYSALNVSISSNFAAREKVSVFIKSGLITVLSLIIFGLIGIAASPYYQSDIVSTLTEILNSMANTGGILIVASVFVVAGFVALQLSTLDGTIIVLQQSLWELFDKESSFKTDSGKAAIAKARFGTFIIGLLIWLITYLFFKANAEIVPLLLTVIWPLTICAPAFAISAFFAAKYDYSLISSGLVQVLFISLLTLSWGYLIVTTARGEDFTTIASIGVCVFGLLFFVAEKLSMKEIWGSKRKKLS